jgi:hypothetical protein
MTMKARIRFLLTGSSVRKLRRGGINLRGQGEDQIFHPLTAQELGERFNLSLAVERGLLPSIYFSEHPGFQPFPHEN